MSFITSIRSAIPLRLQPSLPWTGWQHLQCSFCHLNKVKQKKVCKSYAQAWFHHPHASTGYDNIELESHSTQWCLTASAKTSISIICMQFTGYPWDIHVSWGAHLCHAQFVEGHLSLSRLSPWRSERLKGLHVLKDAKSCPFKSWCEDCHTTVFHIIVFYLKFGPPHLKPWSLMDELWAVFYLLCLHFPWLTSLLLASTEVQWFTWCVGQSSEEMWREAGVRQPTPLIAGEEAASHHTIWWESGWSCQGKIWRVNVPPTNRVWGQQCDCGRGIY